MSPARRETPPHDVDAERAALGAVLLTADAANYALDRGLDSSVFYDVGHQAAWHAIRATIARRPEVLNATTVGNDATTDGTIDDITTTTSTGRVAGRRALAELEAAGRTVGYVSDLDTVLELARRRAAIGRANELLEAARTGAALGPLLAGLNDLADAGSVGEQYRRELLRGAELYNVPELEPLIDELLDLNTLACIYGPAGGGKSFVAVDLAMRVARGQAWNGREVKAPRTVLYVLAEGVAGMADRIRAWYAANEVWGGINTDPPPDNLVWLPRFVDLLDTGQADALGRIARELGAGLVIVDTLNRCMPGADENTSQGMGGAVAGLDTVRRMSGACVLAVHHVGKDATRGMRGHTSLLAALDTALEVRAAEGVITLDATKQKNRGGGHIGRGALKPSGPALAIEWGASAPVTFDWIVDALTQLDAGDGVSVSVLVEHTGRGRSTVWAGCKAALDAGLVTKPSRGVYQLAT